MYDILELNKKLLSELRDIAKELKIKRVESFRKQDLIYKILDTQAIVVSESKTNKKESPKKESAKKEKTEKDNIRKDTVEAKSDSSQQEPKKRPGRPKKEKKRESEIKAEAVTEKTEVAASPEKDSGKELKERPKSKDDKPFKKEGGRRGDEGFTEDHQVKKATGVNEGKEEIGQSVWTEVSEVEEKSVVTGTGTRNPMSAGKLTNMILKD